MIPPFYAAVDNGISLLKPDGYFGLADFGTSADDFLGQRLHLPLVLAGCI